MRKSSRPCWADEVLVNKRLAVAVEVCGRAHRNRRHPADQIRLSSSPTTPIRRRERPRDRTQWAASSGSCNSDGDAAARSRERLAPRLQRSFTTRTTSLPPRTTKRDSAARSEPAEQEALVCGRSRETYEADVSHSSTAVSCSVQDSLLLRGDLMGAMTAASVSWSLPEVTVSRGAGCASCGLVGQARRCGPGCCQTWKNGNQDLTSSGKRARRRRRTAVSSPRCPGAPSRASALTN